MKTYLAVKTTKRAVELLESNEFILSIGRCECGETACIESEKDGVVKRVLVCASCGDDNHFTEDVLQTIRLSETEL